MKFKDNDVVYGDVTKKQCAAGMLIHKCKTFFVTLGISTSQSRLCKWFFLKPYFRW